MVSVILSTVTIKVSQRKSTNIFPFNKKTNHESNKARGDRNFYITMMFYFQLLIFHNGEIYDWLSPCKSCNIKNLPIKARPLDFLCSNQDICAKRQA